MKLFRIKNELTCFFSDWNRRHWGCTCAHALVGFQQFSAGSRSWHRHLDLTFNEVKWREAKVKNIAKSLKEVVWKDKLESHAKGDDILDIEPGQVATYLEDPPGPLSVLILVIMVLWNNYKFIFVSLYLICSNLCISDMSLPLFWC